MKNRFGIATAAMVAVPALLLAACGSSSSSEAPATGDSGAATTQAAAGQPDVNGDGQVIIGIMSPGDTNDNGYYESFVTAANAFAGENGWKVITIDKINPADAQNQALNLCRQSVDLIAIGASEIGDALNAAPDPACAGINWYVNGGQGVEQTKYFAQSTDDVSPDLLAIGYAAGLAMKQENTAKASWITGVEADFSKLGAQAFRAGIKQVIPDATLSETYTGDFNDSAKAKEAAQTAIGQGVGLIYPYLGGATDAVASLANENNVLTVTPGTDRCVDPKIPISISAIFSPGDYFAAALADFKDGKLEMGTARVWKIGVDPVPTIKMCGDYASLQPQVDDYMKQIGAGDIDVQVVIKAGTS
jgi:basic membrane protein A